MGIKNPYGFYAIGTNDDYLQITIFIMLKLMQSVCQLFMHAKSITWIFIGL